jgi:hypothetical protein
VKARLQPELGVAMAIALESSEADIRAASVLLEDTANPHAARSCAARAAAWKPCASPWAALPKAIR